MPRIADKWQVISQIDRRIKQLQENGRRLCTCVEDSFRSGDAERASWVGNHGYSTELDSRAGWV
ncbi:MAG: hypothetical protein D6806_00205 [Deltaproteobacteria bacterium]|nr:MAG: hypothetical protein D6806_00205 [Deltaproteobacteria bacterium]